MSLLSGCGARTGLAADDAGIVDGPTGTADRVSSDAPDAMADRPFGPVADHALGPFHTCAALEDGSLWCWGLNDHGQLGTGDREDRSLPVRLERPVDVVQVETGLAHTCARTRFGEVWCWGWSRDDQVGDGTWTSAPADPGDTRTDVLEPVEVLRDVTLLAVGLASTYAVHADGGESAWGQRAFGSLGDGGLSEGRFPSPLPGVTGVTHHAGGACHLREGAEVHCWGWNERGNVGDGTTVERASPVHIFAASPATAIARAAATCAILVGGLVRCWGDNQVGAVG